MWFLHVTVPSYFNLAISDQLSREFRAKTNRKNFVSCCISAFGYFRNSYMEILIKRNQMNTNTDVEQLLTPAFKSIRNYRGRFL